MQEQIEAIADHYGYDSQSRQLIEEMSELTVAINKLWRLNQTEAGKDFVRRLPYRIAIIEEIADVELMIEQIKYLMDCEIDVEETKERKIERQLARIEKEDITQ